MYSGARQLPVHHVSIRVPWHDNGWVGTVCKSPGLNTACRVLPRIAESKVDAAETALAGQAFNAIEAHKLPPCISERAGFMAPFPVTTKKTHPYTAGNTSGYEHFRETSVTVRPYAAACVPFRWTLMSNTLDLAEQYRLGYEPKREPTLDFESTWVQERGNQLALLDTFFSAITPTESLCFFYAKDTPLSSSARRVIVGVGRVLDVGSVVEYQYAAAPANALRSVIWEREVVHSIRPGFTDGFLFPYAELLEAAQARGLDPEQFLAFAPDEAFESFSYASELVSHDHAIASIRACVNAIERFAPVLGGSWESLRAWLDGELNRLWRLRGAFPGFGSALATFLGPGGNLVAYELAAKAHLCEAKGEASDPWAEFHELMANPESADGVTASIVGAGFARVWNAMPPERRALLELLSRFSLSDSQLKRMFETGKRPGGVSDAELMKNPYLVYECDRQSEDPITIHAVDRGMLPPAGVASVHPLPKDAQLEDAVDPRRVRALVVAALEDAAVEGHTVLPATWLAERVAAVAPQDTPCPIGTDVLNALSADFAPIVLRVPMADGSAAYQLDRHAQSGGLIRQVVDGRSGARAVRHDLRYDWRSKVDAVLPPMPSDPSDQATEEKARVEKARAMEELACSRLSVLIGPAGTGKTTLLKVLCDLPEVKAGGILLLAPTGKARVQLERKTGQEGAGKTIAQFLLRVGKRYDGATNTYRVTGSPDQCADFKTVIVDECSMLTEEQLAALLDALKGVQRYVFVGDHRQLPPIGSGRPFVDIVRHLAPSDIESRAVRVDRGYAELTIPRRQQGRARADLMLAGWFGGVTDPASDEIWDRLRNETMPDIRFVAWKTPDELPDILLGVLIEELKLAGRDDEVGFMTSLGGEAYGDRGYMWRKLSPPGNADKTAESWQVISPVRASEAGVDRLNSLVQSTFRRAWFEEAAAQRQPYQRRILQPLGRSAIIYGDKVINLRNHSRRVVWPERDSYVANGDVGMVVGAYKPKGKGKELFKQLEVEFTTQPTHAYRYWKNEFGEQGTDPLDLAYALTVHKTQGSEFRLTFVILPNPCWLLSRELLYTALTRQQERVVVLHQGDIHELRRYASEGRSDVARRMTNLFSPPDPIAFEHDGKSTFLDSGLIHRTKRGELVRSKSEVIIANELLAQGVKEYAYEKPLLVNGRTRYPDFTIENDDTGETYYWEHLGLLHNPEYQARWTEKLADYQKAGILPVGEGGNLIITRDNDGGAIDTVVIANVITQYLVH